MLEDYCQKLQQLNKEKNQFLKLKYKTNAKTVIDKQENKYHKYIIGQISHKNKLDSLLKLTQVFNQIVRHSQRPVFDRICQKFYQKQNNQSFTSLSEQNQQIVLKNSQQSLQKDQIKILNLKSKLINYACASLIKILSSCQNNLISEGFQSIQQNYKLIKGLQKFSDIIGRKLAFQKNVFFHQFLLLRKNPIKKVGNQNRDNKSFIFSLNEFSEIIPYTIQQESEELSTSLRNIEDIDNKFSPQSKQKLEDTNLLQSQQDQQKLFLESFQKLKQEVIIMKNVLSEKNKQLKLKDEQIYKIKKQYEKKIQNLHDQISNRIQKSFMLKDGIPSKSQIKSSKKIDTHNNSYLKQLQAHIIGDLSPRGNNLEQENVSTQLFQKYMKESFEMRQKMDMARQMCEQFEFDQKTQQGQVMMQIIRLLTPEDRLNAIVD